MIGLTVREPRNVARKGRVQRAGRDKDASVNDAWSRARHTHDEANRHDTQANEDERVPFSHAVTVPCHRDCQNRSCDVDGDGQELRRRGSVSETSDDRREEQRDSVKRADDT